LEFGLITSETISTSSTEPILVIRPGALIGGQNYEFKLTATTPEGDAGYGSVSFTTNAPPNGGQVRRIASNCFCLSGYMKYDRKEGGTFN
jgi:hypothetical protein